MVIKSNPKSKQLVTKKEADDDNYKMANSVSSNLEPTTTNESLGQAILQSVYSMSFIDLASFIPYFVIRFNQDSSMERMRLYPDVNDNTATNAQKTMYLRFAVYNIVLLVILILRVMEYIRVFTEYSMQVKLVKKGIMDIGAFSVFFCFYIFMFSLAYTLLGVDMRGVGDDGLSGDYPKVALWFADFIQVFRNSIGDIGTPGYAYWLNWSGEDATAATELSFTQSCAVNVIWFSFLFHEILMLIIMTNFLIAIVSQSWDEVKDQHVNQLYESRCEIIGESAILSDALGNDTIKKQSEDNNNMKFSYVIFKSRMEQVSLDSEYLGFVRTIKHTTRREISKLKNDIYKDSQIVKKQIVTVDQKMDDMTKIITDAQNNIKNMKADMFDQQAAADLSQEGLKSSLQNLIESVGTSVGDLGLKVSSIGANIEGMRA